MSKVEGKSQSGQNSGRKKLLLTNPFDGSQQEVLLTVGNYQANPYAMAIIAYGENDECFGALTVNLRRSSDTDSILPFGCTFLDTNNDPPIIIDVHRAGIAKPFAWFDEPIVGTSGFCTYPLYKFDLNKLSEYDPEGVAEYKHIYMNALKQK